MNHEEVVESAEYLRKNMQVEPQIALILGSGLGRIGDKIESATYIDYATVPHMVRSTAIGHVGRFITGILAGKPVICMQGRFHAYEGHSAQDIAYPIFVMKELGVKTLVITNASGGINMSFSTGDIMMITDHINLTGMNPLMGPHDSTLGPRHNDMTYAYEPTLRRTMKSAASKAGVQLREGVYIGDLGPSFETPAEIRAYRALGADAVGMSTVFEVIAASDAGLPTVALSLITNMAAGVLDQPISSEEVQEIGARRAADMENLICEFIREC